MLLHETTQQHRRVARRDDGGQHRLGSLSFLPQHIVIGHLNWMPVTTVFDRLRAIIVDRGLTTVTLNDVYSSAYHP